jgi:hypothetical protein
MKIPHNISDYFKLRLLKSAYPKIKRSNSKLIEYDNKIKALIKFIRLKSIVILLLFMGLNFKFIITASFSDMFLSLFWLIPVCTTLTTAAVIVYFQN